MGESILVKSVVEFGDDDVADVLDAAEDIRDEVNKSLAAGVPRLLSLTSLNNSLIAVRSDLVRCVWEVHVKGRYR